MSEDKIKTFKAQEAKLLAAGFQESDGLYGIYDEDDYMLFKLGFEGEGKRWFLLDEEFEHVETFCDLDEAIMRYRLALTKPEKSRLEKKVDALSRLYKEEMERQAVSFGAGTPAFRAHDSYISNVLIPLLAKLELSLEDTKAELRSLENVVKCG